MQRKPKWSRGLVAVICAGVLASIALHWAVRQFLFSAYHASGLSMLPNVGPGDWFWVDKWTYRRSGVRRGDLVVIASPKNPATEYLTRVIAVAGDHVSVKGELVEVNGKRLRAANAPGEPFEYSDKGESNGEEEKVTAVKIGEQIDEVRYQVLQDVPRYFDKELSVEVPGGEIYALGDNRDRSLDGRYWGPVPVSSVHGRVVGKISKGGPLRW